MFISKVNRTSLPNFSAYYEDCYMSAYSQASHLNLTGILYMIAKHGTLVILSVVV